MADLLIDEGIGQHLVQRLRAQGYRIFHTFEFLPKGASDSLVFFEAQRRQLTVFTWNRDDFILLAEAWQNWGHGSHYGVISRPEDAQQPAVAEIYLALERYCQDISSFMDRIELI